MTRHKWEDYDCALGQHVMECARCGAFRYRLTHGVGSYSFQVPQGVVYIDGPPPPSKRGWRYGGGPRSCPGSPTQEEDPT